MGKVLIILFIFLTSIKSFAQPTAFAGVDMTVQIGYNDVYLWAGNSNLNGGTSPSYSWVQVSGPAGVTIINSTSALAKAVNLNNNTVYQFQVTVTASNGSASDVVQIIMPDNGGVGVPKTVTWPSTTQTQIFYNNNNANNYFGVAPGDTLLIDASKLNGPNGIGSISTMQIGGLRGRRGAPITIRNINGPVVITGTSFLGSLSWLANGNIGVQWVNIISDTTQPNLTSQSYNRTQKVGGKTITRKWGFQFNNGVGWNYVSNIKADGLFLNNHQTGVGVFLKIEPTSYTAPDYRHFFPYWKISGIEILRCGIDSSTEGTYIAHTDETADAYAAGYALAIPTDSVTIKYCLVTNSKWDGIQVGGSNWKIIKNYVYNFGTQDLGSQQMGIITAKNGTGIIDSNIIIKGTGPGIQVTGKGVIQVRNNYIDSSALSLSIPNQTTVFINDLAQAIYNNLPAQSVRFENNTVLHRTISTWYNDANYNGTRGQPIVDNNVWYNNGNEPANWLSTKIQTSAPAANKLGNTIASSLPGNPSDTWWFGFDVAPPVNPPVAYRRFYVDTLASAGGNGSLSTPWKTLNQVNSFQSNLLPGDTISLKRNQDFKGHIYFDHISGTKEANIVFNTFGIGAKPRIHVDTIGYGNIPDDRWLFRFYNSNHISVNDLYFFQPGIDTTDNTNSGTAIGGIALYFDGSNGCKSIGNDFSSLPAGVAVRGDSALVRRCNFWRLIAGKNDVGNGDDDWGSVPITLYGASHCLIDSNYAYRCYSPSLDYGINGGNGGSVEFFFGNCDSNTVLRNTFVICSGSFEFGGSPGNTAKGNVIMYNTCINSGSWLTIHQENSQAFPMDVENLKFWNNTMYEDSIVFTNAKNMILVDQTSNNVNVVDMRYNNFINKNLTSPTIGINNAYAGNVQLGGQLIHMYNTYTMNPGDNIGYILDPTETLTVWQQPTIVPNKGIKIRRNIKF